MIVEVEAQIPKSNIKCKGQQNTRPNRINQNWIRRLDSYPIPIALYRGFHLNFRAWIVPIG